MLPKIVKRCTACQSLLEGNELIKHHIYDVDRKTFVECTKGWLEPARQHQYAERRKILLEYRVQKTHIGLHGGGCSGCSEGRPEHEILFGEMNLVMGEIACTEETAEWLQEQLNK